MMARIRKQRYEALAGAAMLAQQLLPVPHTDQRALYRVR